jgi:hypothetical protein
MKKAKKVLSLISNIHYLKLGFRILLFCTALGSYLIDVLTGHNYLMDIFSDKPIVFRIIWAIFIVEIALRFFPSRLESMGCQKQFKHNYKPRIPADDNVISHKKYSAIIVAIITVIAAAIVGILYYTHIIDESIIFIICLFFSIVDMVCILFFCPFQEWIMKNKCCVTCQIYNWDYPMMFLPLIFIKNFYTWSLLGISLALVIEWEILKALYPERFLERSNCSLSCENCREKLCSHKTSLRRFLAKIRSHKNKTK